VSRSRARVPKSEPSAAFADRWCAKEAVFKSLGVVSEGAGAQLKDIEILSDEGRPKVVVSCSSSYVREDHLANHSVLRISSMVTL
jgi:phosphopantetheine--protein transferase-like protein